MLQYAPCCAALIRPLFVLDSMVNMAQRLLLRFGSTVKGQETLPSPHRLFCSDLLVPLSQRREIKLILHHGLVVIHERFIEDAACQHHQILSSEYYKMCDVRLQSQPPTLKDFSPCKSCSLIFILYRLRLFSVSPMQHQHSRLLVLQLFL